MKKIVVLVSLCLSVILAAQTKEMYQKEMEKIVVSLDSATSLEQITDLNNRLVRVNRLFPDQWQPLYYEAYIDLCSFFIKPDLGIAVLNDAEDRIREALSIERADKSELWALQGYIMMMKISTDPMNLGASLTGSVYNILEKSIKENPENPRPRLVLINFSMGKKMFFKEDVSSECEQLPRIENLMKSEHKTPLTPKWERLLFERVANKCLK